MIILWYSEGNGWSWRSPDAAGLIESSAAWEFLERMQRGGSDGRVSYPTHTREALTKELTDLELDLSLVVLRIDNDTPDIRLDIK